MTVELYNETTHSFDDVTDEFQALDLDLEINIVEGHSAEYSGASFEIPGDNVTLTNGLYIRFREGSTQIYSGYITSLVKDTKRNRYSFDVKNEIDQLKSHRISKAISGTTIEDILTNALDAIQLYPRYEHFDTYTLGITPSTNGWETPGGSTGFLTDNTRAALGSISLHTNRTSENYTEIVSRFPDIEEGKVIWEHWFYMPSGGSAESWQVKIGNGDVGSMNLAAYYTLNGSDVLLHHDGAGGTTAVSGSPTVNRNQWNQLLVTLDIEAETMTTIFNSVEVDTDYAFEDSMSFIDMVHYRCQFSGFTSPNNFWVDQHEIGHKNFLNEYTIVAMDSIAQAKLDLDNTDYSGLTTSLSYPGDLVQGSDSSHRYCWHEHVSEVYNKPVTGNAYDSYWKPASPLTGGAWVQDTNYGRATYNDLLHDMLLLMNGNALQHHVIVNVVNHEIRFYGHTEIASSSALTASLIEEWEQDLTGDIYTKQMSDRAVQNLRGSGTVSGAGGEDYEYQIQKYEHKLRYADILDIFEFRTHNSIEGLITAMSIRKSVHEYVLTEIEGIGVL